MAHQEDSRRHLSRGLDFLYCPPLHEVVSFLVLSFRYQRWCQCQYGYANESLILIGFCKRFMIYDVRLGKETTASENK